MTSAGALPMNQNPGIHEEAALVRAARSDPSAFGALHLLYEDRMYRYMRSRTESAEDAADLTQQAFLQALDALPRYKERGLPFAAWLFRIARNVATDAHRRRKSALPWDMLPEALHPRAGQDPEQEALRGERRDTMRALLAGLPPEERELVTLRFVGGLKLEEIASVVGSRRSTVHRRLSAILRTLKERYGDE